MHPVLFRLGPITLYSYGLTLAIGFFIAAALVEKRAAGLRLPARKIQNLTLIVLCAGIVGARAAYVLLHWDFFRSDPLEILRLHHGGLVFYGGLLFGLVAVFFGIRRSKLPGWITVDLLVPPLVLAHAIGRLGCFLNGCCYGKPSTLPWAVAFPPERVPRHPTQLYESGALLVLFFILKSIERRRMPPPALFFAYGFLYGVWRFGIEFLRGDNPLSAGGLTVFQWWSIPLVASCGWMFVRLKARAQEE